MNNLIYKFYNEPSIDLLKNIFNEYNFHPNKLHPIIFNLSLLHVRQPYETMKYLLDKGGDPNLDNPLDNKPIHFQKDYKTIRLLLDRGAIPNPRDIYDFIGGNKLEWINNGSGSLPLNSLATDIFIRDEKCVIDLNPANSEFKIIQNQMGTKEQGILIGDYKVNQPKDGRVRKQGVMQTPLLETDNDKQAF